MQCALKQVLPKTIKNLGQVTCNNAGTLYTHNNTRENDEGQAYCKSPIISGISGLQLKKQKNKRYALHKCQF